MTTITSTLTLDLCTEDPDCGPPLPAAHKVEDVYLGVHDHAPAAYPGIEDRTTWTVESENPELALATVRFTGPEADLEALALGYCAGDPVEAAKTIKSIKVGERRRAEGVADLERAAEVAS
ncbi:hypothetical protein [Streptomyces albidoflavus]|uniref:hypothetical protein n=1 Tax=Streptomyces albidoflavus TaxID=1886 RepID=UPI0033DA05CC